VTGPAHQAWLRAVDRSRQWVDGADGSDG